MSAEQHRALTLGERQAFLRGEPMKVRVVYVEGRGYRVVVPQEEGDVSELDAEVKAKLRAFLAEKGKPVLFSEREKERWPNDPDMWVSTYGWQDFDAHAHVKHGPCEWVVPEGATVQEVTYNQFEGTFTDNKDEIGLNVEGCHCKCGKYTDMTLRWVGTFTEVMRHVLDIPAQHPKFTL